MFNRVSIKYKLLSALIFLPLLGLSIYTYYAVNLIKEDKIAYVMNATNSSARTITTSLLLTMESHRALNEIVLNDFINKRSQEDFLEKFEQKNIIHVSSYLKQDDGSFKQDDQKTYTATSYQKDFKKVNLLNEFQGFLSSFTSEENQFFLFQMIPSLQANVYFTYDNKVKQAFFTVTLAETFFNELSKKDFYNKIIKVDAQINIWGDSLDSDFTKELFKEHRSLDFSKTSENGDSLYSLGPSISDGRIRVLTLASKKYVYAPIYQLTEKTIIFFLLLLGISLSISIFISDKLSKRIIALTDSTKRISEGSYDITLDDKSQDEVGQLARSFESMAIKVKNLLNELRKHNEELEKIVAERTKDLRETLTLKDAMLNSLGQGFFIFKEDGGVENIFTKATFDMFENVKEQNKIWDILNFPTQESEKFQKVIQHTFMEVLDFEDAIALAPGNLKTKGDKYIGLQYFPLEQEDDLEGVILVATDKTEEVKARESYELEKMEIKKLSLALKAQSMFLEYIREFDTRFHQIMNAVENNRPDSLKQMQGHLHTMKGLSYQFYFNPVGDKIHELEDLFHLFLEDQSTKGNNYLKDISRLLKETYKAFNNELSHISDNLNIDGKDTNNMPRTINSKQLDRFYDQVKGTNLEKDFFKDLYAITITDALTPYYDLIKDLGPEYEKVLCPLKVSGGDIKIHPKKYNSFFLSLTHIFRNMVIHGIETSAERELLNKDLIGKISVDCIEQGNSLEITIKDDGRGLNLNAIKEKLQKINHPIMKKSPSDKELMMVIFEPSFSTSEKVNEGSGRGVGLSAVMNEVRQLNGSISVTSKQNEGTEFLISLPHSHS